MKGLHNQPTNQLTNSRKQTSSTQANSCLASQEIPGILSGQKVRCCVFKSPPLVPTLSLMNPVHMLPSYSFMIHSNIILLSIPMIHKQSSSFTSSITSRFYHPNIWQGVQAPDMQFSPASHYFLPFGCKYSPWHLVLKCRPSP